MSAEDGPGSGDWAAPGSSTPPPGWSTEQPPPSDQPAWGSPAAVAKPDASAWGTPYAPPPPPRPGIIPLRPLGVGELLDGAFTAIRRYPRVTLGLAAAVMLVVAVVDLLTQWYLLNGIEPPSADAHVSDAANYLSRVGTATVIDVVVTVFATLLLSGLITVVIGEAVLGRPMSAGEAWKRLRPLVWRLIGVSVLTFVIVAGVALAAILPGIIVVAAGAEGLGIALLVIGGIAAFVGSIYLYFSLALAPAALVLEKQSVRGALSRSRALVRRSWWRVFGILLLASIIAAVLSGIIALPFGLAGGGLSSLGDDTESVRFTDLVLSAAGSLLAGTIVRPFSAGVAALLYIDRRIRAEALDVSLTRAATETGPE